MYLNDFDLALSVVIIPLLDVLLQLFVEFENATQRCSWVKVFDEGVKAVMVEDSIAWISRSDSIGATGASASTTPCPALVSASSDWEHRGVWSFCLCYQFVFNVKLLGLRFLAAFFSCLIFGELNWQLYSTLNCRMRMRDRQQPQPCPLMFTTGCCNSYEERL